MSTLDELKSQCHSWRTQANSLQNQIDSERQSWASEKNRMAAEVQEARGLRKVIEQLKKANFEAERRANQFEKEKLTLSTLLSKHADTIAEYSSAQRTHIEQLTKLKDSVEDLCRERDLWMERADLLGDVITKVLRQIDKLPSLKAQHYPARISVLRSLLMASL